MSIILRIYEFLSTPSARRATQGVMQQRMDSVYFYPRPPRGGRQRAFEPVLKMIEFLSTPSARRATTTSSSRERQLLISIHALREEGDRSRWGRWSRPRHFYPRPPRGGRRGSLVIGGILRRFLSTPSARRATPFGATHLNPKCHFYPRPPRGGRQQKQRQNLYFQTNYTTFCTNLEEP